MGREMRNSPAGSQLSLPIDVLPGETASADNCSLPHDSSQGLLAQTNIYLGKQNSKYNKRSNERASGHDSCMCVTATWSPS